LRITIKRGTNHMAIHAVIINKESRYFGKSHFPTNTLELNSEGVELFEDNPTIREQIINIKNYLGLVLKFNGQTIRTHQDKFIK